MQLNTAYPAGGQFQLPFLKPTPWAAIISSSVTYWTQRRLFSFPPSGMFSTQTLSKTLLCFQKKSSETLAFPFPSVLCVFKGIQSPWWRLPYPLRPSLAWHSGVPQPQHSQSPRPQHCAWINFEPRLPAFTAQIFSVSTGTPHYFFILLKIKKKPLQNTTSKKVVPRGALI